MAVPQSYPARSFTTRAAPRDHAGGLEFLAWLMDRAIPIPGTPFCVGLDAIIGLLPFGGDFVTGLIQAGIVLVALYRYRVPRAVAARMALNVLLDTTVGSIPLVGDVFDAGFKANTRNIQLLREAQEHEARGEPMPAGPSVRFLVGIGVLLGAVLVLALIGFVALVGWLIRRPVF